MKGIVLAGGLGTRLAPLTQNDNKHLLPVFNKRMVEYPIECLVNAGITDIILVTGGQSPGKFLEYLKNGKSRGVNRLYYTYQDGNKGIADALKLAKPFINQREGCVVILGDNYFEAGISAQYQDWVDRGSVGANVLLKTVDKPWDFGIADTDEEGKIIDVEEKPRDPKSDKAILGCYMFDFSVWKYIDRVQPSRRDELEITDVLTFYMNDNQLYHSTYEGFWMDMGTFENWSKVSTRIFENSQGEENVE